MAGGYTKYFSELVICLHDLLGDKIWVTVFPNKRPLAAHIVFTSNPESLGFGTSCFQNNESHVVKIKEHKKNLKITIINSSSSPLENCDYLTLKRVDMNAGKKGTQ